MKWRNWVSAMIGLWFVVSPWVLGVADQLTATWMSVAVGSVQFAVCAWAAIRDESPGWGAWANWIAIATGFWFVVHPFLGHFEYGPYWAMVGPGIATIAINMWTLMTFPQHRRLGIRRKSRT